MDVWRTRGWEKRGSAGAHDLRNRENDHWTILPAVSEGGMIAAMTAKGPVERVHVEVFLKRQLVSGLHSLIPFIWWCYSYLWVFP
ncbi:hypothetical protein CROQUDRAFT_653759 [Cronartium quercuum f. sp. fusiforme G11]|uniref:Uncharacterized protein n=1 Tax=Cronartium quercuum f. sp. fusiforme G11 TaxID=708437 RepID=A0A9P6NS38_9BASI|nr:hypothetical protein CROQUDRAFT_653759 [Cronartium quercuum f. sp. fusiforme G11]